VERFSDWISVLQSAGRGRRDSWDCWGCKDSRRRRESRNWSISCIWSIWSVLLTGPANQPKEPDRPARFALKSPRSSACMERGSGSSRSNSRKTTHMASPRQAEQPVRSAQSHAEAGAMRSVTSEKGECPRFCPPRTPHARHHGSEEDSNHGETQRATGG